MDNLIDILKSSKIELIISFIGAISSLIAVLIAIRLKKKDKRLKVTVIDENNNKINQQITSEEDLNEWITLGSKQIEELSRVGSNDTWDIDHIKDEKIKILLLSASPQNMVELPVANEFQIIKEELKSSFAKNKINLTTQLGVTPYSFAKIIFEENPTIVHFSGHGTYRGDLALQDNEGNSEVLSPKKLKMIFTNTPHNVKCLILNSGFSTELAIELTSVIPIVIGMTDAMTNRAAISFSEGFYKALGGGKSFEAAFRFGKTLMELEDERSIGIPILFKKRKLPPIKHSR